MIQVQNNTKRALTFPAIPAPPKKGVKRKEDEPPEMIAGFTLPPGRYHETPTAFGRSFPAGHLEAWFAALAHAPRGVQEGVRKLQTARERGERHPMLEVAKLADGTPRGPEGPEDPPDLEDRPEAQAKMLIGFCESREALERYARDSRPEVAAAARDRMRIVAAVS